MEKTAGNDNKWDIIINDLHILASLLYKKLINKTDVI